MKPVNFNGFDLQSGPYRVNNPGQIYDTPEREIIAEELARSNNAVAVFRKYKPRTFTLTGTIRDDTSDQLEAAIDAIKLNLMNQIGDLAYGWAGGYRYMNSECKNVSITRAATDITHCAWGATFYMAIPFGTDNTTQNLITTLEGNTDGSTSLATANIGTFLALPYITITLTAIEPEDEDISIVIGNPASGEYLTITDTFADGDILTIDTVNRQVFNGATLLNPVGNYPAWAPNNGLFDYSDTATSRTIDIAATYNPRYL